jgi:hypothetical protein
MLNGTETRSPTKIRSTPALGEVPVEPQDQDPLLALRQLLQVGLDGVHVDGVLECLVVLAEHVRENRGVVFGARQRRVERGGAERQAGPVCLADLVLGDAEGSGQVAAGRTIPEFLG